MLLFPPTDPRLLKAWSRICAFAWKQKEAGVLQKLRQDPKNTIIEIANKAYHADQDTVTKAQEIIEISSDPGATYSGYLPIPQPVGGLDRLSEENLKILFQAGITGTLRFDDKAELWAKVFYAAWQDLDLLNAIREDPVKNLPRVDGLNFEELQNSKYGILPIPDLPIGLSDTSIEQLTSVGFDLDNLGGIIPLACT